MVLTEPPPPMPSTRRTCGSSSSSARPSALTRFPGIEASAEPPRTVKSSPETTTGRPSIAAVPNTKFEGRNSRRVPSSSYSPRPASMPISWKVAGSARRSMRSRTVSLPNWCWRATFSAPPICRASSSRRRSSSISGFQDINGGRRMSATEEKEREHRDHDQSRDDDRHQQRLVGRLLLRVERPLDADRGRDVAAIVVAPEHLGGRALQPLQLVEEAQTELVLDRGELALELGDVGEALFGARRDALEDQWIELRRHF